CRCWISCRRHVCPAACHCNTIAPPCATSQSAVIRIPAGAPPVSELIPPGMNPPSYIVVEGPIGVGKTSLARKLAMTFNCDTLLEQPEANPFLTRFYQKPRQYALQTQLFF